VPKDDPSLSHLLAQALSLFAPRPWTATSQAARRAGLDPLVSGVQSGAIVGRYNGIRHRGGLEARTALVPLSWWKNWTAADIRANQLQVDFDVLGPGFATGVEVEKAGLDAAITHARAERASRRVGRPPEHDWEGAQQYAEKDFADRGPFRTKALVVDSLEKYFRSVLREDLPSRDTIDRWLRNEPQRAWAEKLIFPG